MSTLQRCGPYEPGTITLVSLEDGTEFSYVRRGIRPRLPVPGERVTYRHHTGDNCKLMGEGMVVSVTGPAAGEGHGPTCVVLWAIAPKVQNLYK